MGFLYGMLIHKSQQIIGKLSDGEWRFATWRLSVSPRIYRDNPEMLGKRLYLVLKVTTVLTITMEQNQREPLSPFDIVWIIHPD